MRLQDQIRRRVLEGETIPHEEKLFSLFEPHTRWIVKGKAGRPVELGVPLTVLEDQHQFILGWHLQWHGGDVDVGVPLVAACQAQYPELRGCSFDRGFHSPANQQQLAAVLEHVALPAKGRGTEASRAREGKASFVARRRRHPGVESAIHALESHGLDRVRTHGRAGFERTVGISILAANLHRLGRLLQQRAARRSHRTHHPIVWRPSRPHPQYPSFPPLGTDPARPESEQENIIRTFGAPMGRLPVVHLLNQHDPLSDGYHHVT